MNNIVPYIQRDISWLSFNYRVLQEAKDLRVPLLERIKFMAIYSSNLDEFFRVRVANHRNLIKVGKKAQKGIKFDAEKILIQILKILKSQQEELSEIFENQITIELRENNINLIRRQEMTRKQREYVESYFNDHLLPHIQPILLVEDKIKPFLTNASIYLAIQLEDKGAAGKPQYALVKMPSERISRFIELPDKNNPKSRSIIILDDVIRHSIPWIFPGYDIIQSYSIKLTRDAELYIDDEFSGDLIAKIKESLNKRNVGEASRMVYDRNMPAEFLDALRDVFGLSEIDLLPEGRYHNNFDFFQFPDFGKKHLLNQELTPIPIPKLEGKRIWEAISKGDRFIHMPYHSYQSVINFFETAAVDPDVTHIKIIQYRVAKKSRIMDALVKAVKMGKQVSAFIEVKARFDEAANLEWGERLEREGVRVYYSIPGIKVHSKVAVVIRNENGKSRTYAYVSTGNFHEKTAKIYSDLGLFSADKRITKECLRLYTVLETQNFENIRFKHLGIGQFNLKRLLSEQINEVMESAKKGKKAEIILKMNSLQDQSMIKKLYDASQAGVKIILIIRGICSLVSGMSKYSENIETISIVDRYLEHGRIFVFKTEMGTKYFISSADWMYRNLHRRIEMITPVYDPKIQEHLEELINIQLRDNVKARSLNHNEHNSYRQSDTELVTQAQIESYYYIRRTTEGL